VKVRVFPPDEWPDGAAAEVASALPQLGALVITGGNSAAKLYPALAVRDVAWEGIEVFFSDERAVPADSPDSNFYMAREKLLQRVDARAVHRIRGELSPERGAREYGRQIKGRPIAVTILGLGADAHVAALFPNSSALATDLACVAVHRPDGMNGITLSPPVLTRSAKVFLIVTGAAKATAVARVFQGTEPPGRCPGRIFAAHADTTMLLDDDAAAAL
jgi:6-phosphogluconolactonase